MSCVDLCELFQPSHYMGMCVCLCECVGPFILPLTLIKVITVSLSVHVEDIKIYFSMILKFINSKSYFLTISCDKNNVTMYDF